MVKLSINLHWWVQLETMQTRLLWKCCLLQFFFSFEECAITLPSALQSPTHSCPSDGNGGAAEPKRREERNRHSSSRLCSQLHVVLLIKICQPRLGEQRVCTGMQQKRRDWKWNKESAALSGTAKLRQEGSVMDWKGKREETDQRIQSGTRRAGVSEEEWQQST